MKFERLLEVVEDVPVFETGFLLAGGVNPANVRRQLSRWTKAGKLLQLRRGLYALAPPYQKVKPHPFLVANALVHGSYVSLQSALAHHGIIPEYVPRITSVTTARPGQWQTPLGTYMYRHIKHDLFYGYRRVEVSQEQWAFIATPEKALLDLVYLEPGADDPTYLEALRLQPQVLDPVALHTLAARADSPKLQRAADAVADLTACEREGWETL